MRLTFSWRGLLEAERQGAFRALDEHYLPPVDLDPQRLLRGFDLRSNLEFAVCGLTVRWWWRLFWTRPFNDLSCSWVPHGLRCRIQV